MMRERLLEIAERRAHLVARAQAERETVIALLAPVDSAAAQLASVFRAARRGLAEARNHPLLAIAGIALLVAFRPRRALAWLVKGWSLWRFYRGVYAWWRAFAATLAVVPSGAARRGSDDAYARVERISDST